MLSQAILRVGSHPFALIVIPTLTGIIVDLIHHRLMLPPHATAADLDRAVKEIPGYADPLAARLDYPGELDQQR